MPMGMHTVISEGVNTLSGGQRQRVMIARAVARRPRILLFDEATSALDNQSQAIVSRTLGNLNVTRIVIAHRLSTVRQVDRIIVLVDGKIVQTGSFAELSSTPGMFASFAERQLL
jgi:ABC-type bacteriocin/lantibiotic exporter with double-glycine peptidase domain